MNPLKLLFTLGLILLICHATLQADAARPRHKSPIIRGVGGIGGRVSNLVASVCNSAMGERARCMQVLRSDPKFSSAKNYAELSRFILELSMSKARQGQNFLKQLATTNKSPAIAQCADNDYGGAVGSFSSAHGEIKEDPQTANYDAKRAGDGPETCERGLSAEHIVNPAIDNLNREIKLMSLIAFLSTNNLS